MITLNGGPAERAYAIRSRAPAYLRATVNKRTGDCDVLNLPDDEPKRTETLSVYRRTEDRGMMHMRSSIRGASGFYAWASYEHMPEVDAEMLRDNEIWRKWVEQRERFGDLRRVEAVPEDAEAARHELGALICETKLDDDAARYVCRCGLFEYERRPGWHCVELWDGRPSVTV